MHERDDMVIDWEKFKAEMGLGASAKFPLLSWLDETPATAVEGLQQQVTQSVADLQAGGAPCRSRAIRLV